MDNLDSLQAKHLERVRRYAEKGLRSLIHAEYLSLLGREMRSLKGTPFPSRSARMLEARRRIGINHDEVYGGELSSEAALIINTSADTEQYLSATDNDAAGGTICCALRHLQISESEIVRVIAEAIASVKKSARLLRAENAADRENASAAQDSAGRQAHVALREILAKSFRRRTFGGLLSGSLDELADCEGAALMANERESNPYRFEEKRGNDLTKVESACCIHLLRAGKAVKLETPEQEAYVRRTLENSPSVILVQCAGEIVALGAFKGIRSEYAGRVISNSGYDFNRKTPEIGYVVVAENHRKQGLGLAIVRKLCEHHEGALFATTNKDSMKRHLAAVAFEQRGHEWKGEEEALLSLWIRADPAKQANKT